MIWKIKVEKLLQETIRTRDKGKDNRKEYSFQRRMIQDTAFYSTRILGTKIKRILCAKNSEMNERGKYWKQIKFRKRMKDLHAESHRQAWRGE